MRTGLIVMLVLLVGFSASLCAGDSLYRFDLEPRGLSLISQIQPESSILFIPITPSYPGYGTVGTGVATSLQSILSPRYEVWPTQPSLTLAPASPVLLPPTSVYPGRSIYDYEERFFTIEPRVPNFTQLSPTELKFSILR